MILPFVFGSLNPTAVGITHATERVAATAKGKPLWNSEGKGCGKHECLFGTGTGSSVDLFFSPYGHESIWTADEILLHELVHASRMVRGAGWHMPVSGVGGYPNQEEFIADLVQNIYISEKGKEQLFYYNGVSIKAARFLDAKMTPTPGMLTAGLRFSQPNLFAALAQVQAPFNPVRQVDAEYKALMWKIEHSG